MCCRCHIISIRNNDHPSRDTLADMKRTNCRTDREDLNPFSRVWEKSIAPRTRINLILLDQSPPTCSNLEEKGFCKFSPSIPQRLSNAILHIPIFSSFLNLALRSCFNRQIYRHVFPIPKCQLSFHPLFLERTTVIDSVKSLPSCLVFHLCGNPPCNPRRPQLHLFAFNPTSRPTLLQSSFHHSADFASDSAASSAPHSP